MHGTQIEAPPKWVFRLFSVQTTINGNGNRYTPWQSATVRVRGMIIMMPIDMEKSATVDLRLRLSLPSSTHMKILLQPNGFPPAGGPLGG